MPSKELTVKQVQALAKPGMHRVAPQLYLLIKPPPRLSRTWALRLTVNGRATWRGLGSCASVTLADAKAKAMKMRADIHHGDFDPSQPKRKGSAPTFAEIAEIYIADNESGWRWPRAGQSWRNSLHVHASALSRMPVNTITAGHVKDAIHKVWVAKPQTAKKVRGRIQRVLDMARCKAIGMGRTRRPGRAGSRICCPSYRPTALSILRQFPSPRYRD